jgi:hypothetical protein
MTTNRPFFSNFLTAFRARSGVQKASTSPTGAISGASLSSAYAQAAHHQTTSTSQTTNFSTSRLAASSHTKPVQQASTQATSAPTSSTATTPTGFPSSARRHHSTSPYSRSPGSPGPGLRAVGGIASPVGKQRRGSDSSSDGFREPLAADKWYIGGRTAAGEEKFYKLSMVKKPRSLDRLSIDRMSL